MTSSAAVGVVAAAAGSAWFGWSPQTAVLAGLTGFVGGMAPDLDSDSGRPVRIIGRIASLMLVLAAMPVLARYMDRPAHTILAALGILIGFNIFGLEAFKRATRHRGMFHSLPAALTYGAGLTVLFRPLGLDGALGIGAAGMAGVLSHLVLDAVFSLSLDPLKLLSGQWLPDAAAWVAASSLTFWIFVIK